MFMFNTRVGRGSIWGQSEGAAVITYNSADTNANSKQARNYKLAYYLY